MCVQKYLYIDVRVCVCRCILTCMYSRLSYWNHIKKHWPHSPRICNLSSNAQPLYRQMDTNGFCPCRRKQSFGYGDHAPPDAPGFGGEHQQYPPETVGNTVKYISENMTNPPKYKEMAGVWGWASLWHRATKMGETVILMNLDGYRTV